MSVYPIICHHSAIESKKNSFTKLKKAAKMSTICCNWNTLLKFSSESFSWISCNFIGVFPKWCRNSLNSGNLKNNWSMNWVQFKDPISHMCLAGTGSILLSYTRGDRFEPFYCNDKNFVTEHIWGELNCVHISKVIFRQKLVWVISRLYSIQAMKLNSSDQSFAQTIKYLFTKATIQPIGVFPK